jgi:hypothetical protein
MALAVIAYDTLRRAIIARRQVTCIYDGLFRECCPHAIGTKRGRTHVLLFQFAGQSSRGLPPGGQWRCMDVEALSQVTARDGPWFTDPRHSKPQTCIDVIDVEVAY